MSIKEQILQEVKETLETLSGIKSVIRQFPHPSKYASKTPVIGVVAGADVSIRQFPRPQNRFNVVIWVLCPSDDQFTIEENIVDKLNRLKFTTEGILKHEWERTTHDEGLTSLEVGRNLSLVRIDWMVYYLKGVR